MKYEKQFEEFLKSDLFRSKVKIIMELIEQHFENSFLFNFNDIIEKAKKSFTSLADVELSNIYSEEAIKKLIEKNKLIKIKNSYILMEQFKKNYDFMSTFNDLSGEEKNKILSIIIEKNL